MATSRFPSPDSWWGAVKTKRKLSNWAIAFYIRTPLLRTGLSFLPLKKSVKMSTTLKKSTENALTPNEILWKCAKPSRISLEMHSYPQEFHNFSPIPPEEFPDIFILPLRKSTDFCPCPWRIPPFLNRPGTKTLCNSPLIALFTVPNTLLEKWPRRHDSKAGGDKCLSVKRVHIEHLAIWSLFLHFSENGWKCQFQ